MRQAVMFVRGTDIDQVMRLVNKELTEMGDSVLNVQFSTTTLKMYSNVHYTVMITYRA